MKYPLFFSKGLVGPLLAAFLVMAMAFSVAAEAPSAEIPLSIREAAGDILSGTDIQILPVCNAPIFSDQDLRMLVENNGKYYIAVDESGSTVGIRQADDALTRFPAALNRTVLDHFSGNAIMEYFPEGVTLKIQCCIDASSYGQGYAILYQRTDDRSVRQEYVYFHHPQIGEFLFTWNAFSKYRAAILNDPQMRYDLYDLSDYDLHADSFDLNGEDADGSHFLDAYLVWVCIVSMVLTAAVVVILTRHYKKKARHMDDPVVPLCIVCPKPHEPLMDPGNESAIGYLP